MITRRMALSGLLMILSATVGGVVARALDAPAHAQASRELRGDRLTLVDRNGVVRVSLGLSGGDQQNTYFYLNDRAGRERVRFNVPPNADPRVELKDVRGRVIQAAWNSRTPPFADVRPNLSGRYSAPRGGDGPGEPGREDFVLELKPPQGRPARDVQDWLDAHSLALLGIIGARFSTGDMRDFRRAEHSICRQNLYCELAYRQQAIAVISGVR